MTLPLRSPQHAARTAAALAASLSILISAANAGNVLALNAGTVATLRGLAPLPGRALSAAVQARF